GNRTHNILGEGIKTIRIMIKIMKGAGIEIGPINTVTVCSEPDNMLIVHKEVADVCIVYRPRICRINGIRFLLSGWKMRFHQRGGQVIKMPPRLLITDIYLKAVITSVYF